ncbi:hypothetical protein KZ686_03040 [Cupriavidus cauae]|uniref:hypothetical protein n=1 Tax=Cupriavidus TaxID=106589 RepID=UPI001CF4B4C0|nr:MULTISPECIES: hypothetical protein [Cupriavidus]MCA7084717.1 hypothetical protein [Cupriavidus sp. DB3]UZN49628.1 hypothetical protein KZ686_03040 [Cupriavidus cauae]
MGELTRAAGTPPQVLKTPARWETMEMMHRYAHLSADHLAQSVARLAEMQSVAGTCV